MCGIAGIIRSSGKETTLEALGAMAASLRHRGPDGYGFYLEPDAGLAHLKELNQLDSLYLEGNGLSDEAVGRAFPELHVHW